MDAHLFPARATIRAPEHTFVRVKGENPLEFLQNTTTQELREGSSALSCLLDGTGHVLSFFRVIPAGDDVLLDGVAASREALTGWLARVAPLSGCEVIDESGSWTLTMIRGADAGFALPHAPPEDFIARGDDVVVRVTWGIQGYDVLSRNGVAAQTMTPEEYDVWRVRAGIPMFGRDVTSDHIVNETPFLRVAVADAKGCYPGQETVAKIRNLGRARRAVVGLRFDGAAPPPGTEVGNDERAVGAITSSAGDTAIATVRSEVLEAGTVHADGSAARIFALA